MKKIVILIAVICVIIGATTILIWHSNTKSTTSDEKKVIFKKDKKISFLDDDNEYSAYYESDDDYCYRVFGYRPSQWMYEDDYDYENEDEETVYSYTPYYIDTRYPMNEGESVSDYTYRVFGYRPSQEQLSDFYDLPDDYEED